ncbi:hypothetical protein [uncultured Sulfitobacter sp.]|uniref:hypothetical protein n=1 Tax=uncultured Sulfitobacter sp. TaxID=191468 RepID=UPI00260BA121|nr:hypothetical protein [uncultured Sulfitobacter sp.]
MNGIDIIADELGAIREQIKTLKAREASLRARIIAFRPNGPISGSRYTVEVHQRPTFKFDTALLPDAVLDDPQFCKRFLDAEKLPAIIREDDWYYKPVFDRSLLPPEILEDARYNTVKFTTYVVAKTHAQPPQNMK